MDIKFDIAPVDRGIEKDLKNKIDSKTKPVGALGMLEDIALQVGLIQQNITPILSKPIIAVFAGDHGIAEEGVSAYPQEVTGQMIQNMASGGAAINIFCKTHGITSKIIDAGVASELPHHDKIIDNKIALGTANFAKKPAMSRSQCLKAIEQGARLVDRLHQQRTNIIGLGEMGIGNTSSASVITSLITGIPIEKCTGSGTGLDEDGISEKTRILEEAIEQHNIADNPIAVLHTFGGFEIAMIVGALLQAAEHRMIILCDGFIVTAGLLIAERLYPAVRDYVLFAHESGERGHRLQLEYLGATPMLRIGMRLGEGSGAAMAYPVLKSAVNFLNDMASFEDAGIKRCNR